MKLKIKKANKFYLVENDSTQQESTTEQSVSDIFTIKDTDSEFLQNFKEYCQSAVNNAEQTGENNTENTSATSENIPSKESQEKIDKSAEELKKTAAGIAAEEIV